MKTPNRIKSRLLYASATLLASFVATTFALADYPGTVLSQGPAGYWRFSETAPGVSISTAAPNSGSLGATRKGGYKGALAGRGAARGVAAHKAAPFSGGFECTPLARDSR